MPSDGHISVTDPADHFQPDAEEIPGRSRPGGGERYDRSPWSRFFRELPGVIIIALALAILIKTFLMQAFFIPSPSMLPTLEIDDRVLVSKLAYRFHGPEHGDLIVFDSPLVTEERPETLWETMVRNVFEAVGVRTARVEDLIKRVIAVGGDRLEIRNNQVWVNGAPIDEPYLKPGYYMNDMAPRYVPSDHVWVMGDNRDNSQDSRRFGPVPVDDVIGRAFVRIWPVPRWDAL
jgi:signal peptidase I